MTEWNERKNKSLSNVPVWLESAVTQYQELHDLQSWSAALLDIVVSHLNRHYTEEIKFGDDEFEEELSNQYHTYEAETAGDPDHIKFFTDWIRLQVAPPKHGGDRKSLNRDYLE